MQDVHEGTWQEKMSQRWAVRNLDVMPCTTKSYRKFCGLGQAWDMMQPDFSPSCPQCQGPRLSVSLLYLACISSHSQNLKAQPRSQGSKSRQMITGQGVSHTLFQPAAASSDWCVQGWCSAIPLLQQTTWLQIFALSLISCVTLGISGPLYEPQFPQL